MSNVSFGANLVLAKTIRNALGGKMPPGAYKKFQQEFVQQTKRLEGTIKVYTTSTDLVFIHKKPLGRVEQFESIPKEYAFSEPIEKFKNWIIGIALKNRAS